MDMLKSEKIKFLFTHTGGFKLGLTEAVSLNRNIISSWVCRKTRLYRLLVTSPFIDTKSDVPTIYFIETLFPVYTRPTGIWPAIKCTIFPGLQNDADSKICSAIQCQYFHALIDWSDHALHISHLYLLEVHCSP
ncbi:conserved hypothetical protein [Trichinella spiralis]|uniref:hypothetical protein n=1 Tax=Trichinella spiralis TaxID=6334 RepID=UPI0001EFEF24|nr:conserved hypothetical protein [Trichinella spiralis]